MQIKRRSIFLNDYSEGTIEEQSFNSCVYPEEIEIAEKVMNEAELLLQNHATSTDYYKLYHKYSKDSIAYYKKHGNTLIFKFNYKIKYPDKIWINKEAFLSHKIKLKLKNNYYIYICVFPVH